MQANRRRFLSLLGLGAASAPLAAKAAADNQMMALTNLRYANLSAGHASEYVGSLRLQSASSLSPNVAAEQYIRLIGKLPSFVEEQVRERAKNINSLDPDIACKKSWSFSVKIQTQRERNYQAEIARYSINGKYEVAQKTFKKISGFEWPW